ncbi:MAG: ribosome recycling factor [Marinilabiliales bacterium]
MNEEVELLLEITKEKMEKTIAHLQKELSKIRAGKADPHMLDGIFVDYYGNKTPLNQVSSINTPDPRTISIQPWEKSMVEVIEKAILAANIGLTPINNGELIRINVPILTQERRIELVKQVKNEGENTKISIRNIRRDANEEVKKMKKNGLSEDISKDTEDEIQKLTNNFINKVDEIIGLKEKQIMTV